jgi:hypothetical protein
LWYRERRVSRRLGEKVAAKSEKFEELIQDDAVYERK